MSKFCLKTEAKKSSPSILNFNLVDRLPNWIQGPFEMQIEAQVKARNDYYVLDLKLDAVIPVCCQRCLDLFHYRYQQRSELALCANDETAARLMVQYEPLVVDYLKINLLEIVTDELYLSSLDKHMDDAMCGPILQ